MKGQFFIEIVNNTLMSQGQVLENVGPGYWSVRFFQAEGPPITRVIPAQAMVAMTFFKSQQELAEWLQKVVKPAEEPADSNGGTGEGPKTPAPKPEIPPLEERKVSELRAIAKSRDVFKAGMKKAELIAAIRGA